MAGGTNQTNPDFPFLPDLAIERVEIVADGSLGDLRLGRWRPAWSASSPADTIRASTPRSATGQRTTTIPSAPAASSAHDWGRGSILAAYQYAENGNIIGADRDYRIVDFRPYGGVDTRTTVCPSPNVKVNTTAYVVNYAAPSLAPNTTNYCDNGAVTDLVPKSRLHMWLCDRPAGIESHHAVGRGALFGPQGHGPSPAAGRTLGASRRGDPQQHYPRLFRTRSSRRRSAGTNVDDGIRPVHARTTSMARTTSTISFASGRATRRRASTPSSLVI
ncbi:hypothetical protein ACRAWD_22840 [Caulobacter segnis]